MLWRLTAILVLVASSAQFVRADEGVRLGLPWDWSHRNVLWTNPDLPEEALAKGDYPRWLERARDPRFLSRVVRKMDRMAELQAGPRPKATARPNPWVRKPPPAHRDWSVLLGGAGGAGAFGIFPAKYAFDISASPSCTDDFVVYPTNGTAADDASTAFASQSGTVSGNFAAGKIVTINNNGRTLVVTSSSTDNTGFFFITTPTGTTAAKLAAKAANLAAAIDRNGATAGVSATSSGAVVTVTALAGGTAGNAITWTKNLGNFTLAAGTFTGGAGTTGQPTIIAYNHLYSSCGANDLPSIMWSYNTGTGAVAQTSPTISLDGTQVAFLQSTGGAASLVLLKWSASSPGTLGAPTTPASVSAAAYRACSAPCMTVLPLAGGTDDAISSPYYDYGGDQLWVGGTDGTLHKFTDIFNGTPAEAGSPWPVTVVAGRTLSSPVYDIGTGLVFVGSAREATTTTGGRLHSVDNATGAVVTSGLLAGDNSGTGSTGIADAPIVDSQAQRVYAAVFTDTSTDCSAAHVHCNAVYQFATNVSISGLTGVRQPLGRGDHSRILYSGMFEDAYFQSADPTQPTGFLYMCSSAANNAQRPTLWRIPITGNVMGTPVAGPPLVGSNVADTLGHCSPITDVSNGTSEFLFVSVPGGGNDTNCTGACMYSYVLTGLGTWGATVTAAAGLPAPGGTSGIVIDNIITEVGGASQIYYATHGSTAGFGSAVQASQQGLN